MKATFFKHGTRPGNGLDTDMSNFEDKVKAAAESAVLKHIESGVWLAQDSIMKAGAAA